MADRVELWMEDYVEVSKLADDISKMLSQHGSLPPSDPATDRHLLRMRTRIAIMGARLWNLEEHHAIIPKKFIWDKNIRKRKEMLSNLREREKQMASVLDMWHTVERLEDLPGTSKGGVDDEKGFSAGFDYQLIADAQRETMKEQDEVLDRLEETLLVTKHFALVINEELNKTILRDNLDQMVEATDARLQMIQNRRKILNKRTRCGCSWMCLLLVLAVVIMTVVLWMLWKYLFRQLSLGCCRNTCKYIIF